MAFEHLNKEERIIAESAVVKGLVSDNAKYDIKVGEGFVPTNQYFTPSEIEMAKNLTQKRIDAVDESESEIKLIEFTPRLSARTLGNLMSYSVLYKKQFTPSKPVRLVLIAGEDDKDLRVVADAHNISVMIV